MFRLVELLKLNTERIARTITAEMGKSLPDARAELKRTIENCEVACGMPTMIQGDSLRNAAPVAPLPFGGAKGSIFADIKAQSKEVVHFFTQTKIITERYWPEEVGDVE